MLLRALAAQNLGAGVNAGVADEHPRSSDELARLALALAAEGA